MLVVLFATQPLLAQDLTSAPLIKPGDETLSLYLGGIVNQFGTKLKLNGQTHDGTDIDLERNGLKKTQSSFQAAASLGFLSRNRVDVEYFSASRSGTKTYQTEITIGDNVYPLGATVSAEARNDFLIADYRYSFVKSDSVELAGLMMPLMCTFRPEISSPILHRGSTYQSTLPPINGTGT